MNVLSVFDGMSCGQIALGRADVTINRYFASEIKKYAIKVTQKNYPNTIQVGNCEFVTSRTFGSIDINLLIGGSPCQDITILMPGRNINDSKSRLFYEYSRIKKELNPDYFLLENVVGDKDSINIISEILGVEPIRINSRLLSFQNRDRLYWTNIPNVTIPEDKKISFQGFKETDFIECEKYRVNKTPSRIGMWEGKCPNVTDRDKINCLTVKQDRWSNAGLISHDDFCRYLTIKECELAQTVPVGYTSCLTRNQSYDVLGDGWTVDVIAHIFKGLLS